MKSKQMIDHIDQQLGLAESTYNPLVTDKVKKQFMKCLMRLRDQGVDSQDLSAVLDQARHPNVANSLRQIKMMRNALVDSIESHQDEIDAQWLIEVLDQPND